MARQPIVLQPPPGQRNVVVLREGEAQKSWGIWITGALGLLLLVAAVFLVAILPEDDTPLPQYQVSFEEQRSTIDGATITLFEGGTNTFTIPYEGDSLFGLAISLTWQDDLAASLPDVFEANLINPNGTVVFGPKELRNAQPVAGANPGTYEATTEERVLSFALAPRPSTEILSATSHDESLESVQERAKDLQGDPAGEWQLEITLQTAGDCPDPASFDSMRALACRTAAPDGLDGGNDIQILGVEFIEYYTTVTPL